MDESKRENSEQKAVEYLKSQIDYNQPKAVLAIYTQIIEQDIFHTRVGLSFLTGLKKYLVDHGMIEDEDKKPSAKPKPEEKAIEVPKAKPKEETKEEPKEETKEEPHPKVVQAKPKEVSRPKEVAGVNPYKKRFFYSLFFNGVLVVVIILMFVITLTSDNPNILNYKKKIQDEYASWEQDLTNREKALDSWERDLNDRQNLGDEE